MLALLSLNKQWSWRCLVAEAIACLALARALIALVPFRHWRRSLGSLSAEKHSAQNESVPELVLRIAQAVNRGARYLPLASVCLPRAMAVQWMCARRDHSTELIFGVQPGGRANGQAALHAWVEYDGVAFIGQEEKHEYQRNLALKKTGKL